MKKTIILFLTLLLSSLFFVNNTNAETIIQSNFLWSDSARNNLKTICSNYTYKCYFYYSQNVSVQNLYNKFWWWISIASPSWTATNMGIIQVWKYFISYSRTGTNPWTFKNYVYDTENDYNVYTYDYATSSSANMKMWYSSNWFSYIRLANNSTDIFKISSIYEVTKITSASLWSVTEWNLPDVLNTTDKIKTKMYFYWWYMYYASDKSIKKMNVTNWTITNVFTLLNEIKDFSITYDWIISYTLIWSPSNATFYSNKLSDLSSIWQYFYSYWWVNYFDKIPETIYETKLFQNENNTFFTLKDFNNNSINYYLSFSWNLVSDNIKQVDWNTSTWTSTSSSMTGTITSTGIISLKREQQTCTWKTFSVSSPTTSESYINTSSYIYCWGVNTPCTDDLLSDVYDSNNSLIFRSNLLATSTYNVFNSWASFTGISINSYNPFSWIWYMANSTIWTQLLKIKTTNYDLWDTTIKVELTDNNWLKNTTEIQANKNTIYNVYFTDKREISLYKIVITTDKANFIPVLKNISYFKYTSWSSSQNKTRYKCTSQYLSCDWIDYDTPEKQSYCYQNGDYNYIKDDYLVQNYEDNTQKNISLDTSGLDTWLKNIDNSIKDIKNSFWSWASTISSSWFTNISSWSSLVNSLSGTIFWTGLYNSTIWYITWSQFYQSFSWVINSANSVFGVWYNTGVLFSWSCGNYSWWYPLTLYLPTGSNLSFQSRVVYMPNSKYIPCNTANLWSLNGSNTTNKFIFKYLLYFILIAFYYTWIYFYFKYFIVWPWIFLFSWLKNVSQSMSFWILNNSDQEWNVASFALIAIFLVSFVVMFNYFTGWLLSYLLSLLSSIKDILGNLLNFIFTTMINENSTLFSDSITYISSWIMLLILWYFTYLILQKYWGIVAILFLVIAIVMSFYTYLNTLFWELLANITGFFSDLFHKLFSFFL